MEDIKKPDLSISWAQEGGVIEPDEDKVKLGWIGEVPLAQWQNWWQLRADKSLNYVLQKGIPEWDENTFYIEDKSFVQYNGEVYVCKWTGRGQHPSNNPTRWARLQDYLNLDAKVDIDALPNILSPKADKSITISGVGDLTGGGDLSANRTLDLTSAAKDSLQKANTSVQPSRKVVAGTGLEGGGDLSADRTLSVKFGTTAGTVTQGNDSRLSNAREWTASTVSQAEAEAGAATTRRAWTAQRVRQAIVGWFNSASGTIGRTIFGRNTAAQVRGDLGLGTAATRNVGTSSGNVMEVGAFGLGGRGVANSNLENKSYLATYNLNSLPTDYPAGEYGYGAMLSIAHGYSGTNMDMVFTHTPNSKILYRYARNAPWREIFHTGNILSSTGSSTQYPMSQKAVTDALNTKADKSTSISAGTGLSGGGSLAANRTLSVKYGTSAGTAAQGNDSRIVNALQRGNNLSDVTNPATARNNLGLKGAATRDVVSSPTDTSGGNKLVTQGWMGLGGKSKGVVIPESGSDLNEYQNTGFYSQATNKGASSGSNYPRASAGCLFVYPTAGNNGVGQTYYTYQGAMYIRYFENGNWGPWREIHHTGNVLKTTGNNDNFPMSQKAVTDVLNTKANKGGEVKYSTAIREFGGVGTSGGGSKTLEWVVDLTDNYVMTGVRTNHSSGSDYFTLYPRGKKLST